MFVNAWDNEFCCLWWVIEASKYADILLVSLRFFFATLFSWRDGVIVLDPHLCFSEIDGVNSSRAYCI